MTRLFLALTIVTQLVACGMFHKTAFDKQLNSAWTAFDLSQWETSYRLLEDGFIFPDAKIQKTTREAYRDYPELQEAAAQTFSTTQVRRTLDSHGRERGASIERKRLELYKLVATPEQVRRAKEVIDYEDSTAEARWQQERIAREEMQAKRQKEQEQAAAIAAREAQIEQAKRDELAKQRELVELERKRRAQVLRDELLLAIKASTVQCKGQAQCDRRFALAQAYLVRTADMKVQLATNTLIETYNAVEAYQVSMRLMRVPLSTENWAITLTADCRPKQDFPEGASLCDAQLLLIYKGFPPAVTSVQ